MRGMAKATVELIEFASELLREAYPMTVRQLHYGIFSADSIAYSNTQSDYKRLSKATTLARRAYRDWQIDGDDDNQEPPANSIPPSWMVDETRNPETPNVFDDVDKYIDAVGVPIVATTGRPSQPTAKSSQRRPPFWDRCVPWRTSLESF